MKKASAITLDIFIMMIMLAVLLGFTAYYVDQITVRPVVLMIDSEVNLRCFFVLSQIASSEYVREGEPVPDNSLRMELLKTYGLSNSQEKAYFGTYQDTYEESLNLMYGDSKIIVRNDDVFWTTVQAHSIPVACSMNVFGPVRTGTAGLFTTDSLQKAKSTGRTLTELMDYYQNLLYPILKGGAP
ncbi:hypothetical protein COS83_00545 [archaeon CG07_land_8_20_14_0_80_38_8]|nr:MAG: hypothetical protein COS83_00545 [archaeon CG07_land_8_20_14_0_80_38_8]PIU89337.1 MAG: hypothetical protein COS64_00945 [archaeon CG06_land_8_20_14_3_00_37_11]